MGIFLKDSSSSGMFSISSVSSLFRELFSGSSGYEEEPEIFSSKWRLHFNVYRVDCKK